MRISDWSSDVCSSDLADAGRAIQLVAGKHVEIRIQRLHVDRHVLHSLAAVDQRERALFMGDAADIRHRHDGAQRVRDMGDGEERKSAESGTMWAVSVDLGGCRTVKKKKTKYNT